MTTKQTFIALTLVAVLSMTLPIWAEPADQITPNITSPDQAKAPFARSKTSQVTIAIVSPDSPRFNPDHSDQKIVDDMIRHWTKEFQQVLPDNPDLIVVPEICDIPSGLRGEREKQYLKTRGNQIYDHFAKTARENHCYLVYSTFHFLPDETLRNTSFLFDRLGNLAGKYDKYHPTIGEVNANILPGNEPTLIQTDFGTVAMALCFDLNFDPLRLKYVKQKPDIILFSSMYHGGLMQPYWAYSCRAHFVGAIHPGAISQVRDPLGEVLAETTNYFDYTVTTVNLDCRLVHLDYHWKKLAKLKEKYGPYVTIKDPGHLGSVLVTSHHPDISADQMLKEFEIELLDDYFNRALDIQNKNRPPEKL